MEDVAAAFETILTKGRIGETYNIGTQKERTVLEVARDIAAAFDLPSDNITHVRDRAFNDQRCAPRPACLWSVCRCTAGLGASRRHMSWAGCNCGRAGSAALCLAVAYSLLSMHAAPSGTRHQTSEVPALRHAAAPRRRLRRLPRARA